MKIIKFRRRYYFEEFDNIKENKFSIEDYRNDRWKLSTLIKANPSLKFLTNITIKIDIE